MKYSITRRSAWSGLILVMVLVIVGLRVTAVGAAPSVQLAFVLDGSTSISSVDFQKVKLGLAAAILAKVPQNGSVEIVVVQFSGNIIPNGARVEVPPTVITNATDANNVATAIQNIVKGNGLTPMAAGIDLARQEIVGSPNFATASRQLINIASDGNPNQPINPITAAINARTAAVNAGIEELDAEGVGQDAPTPAFQTFLCNLVWPQPAPSQPCAKITAPNLTGFPNPPGSQGFVLLVENLDDFAAAIAQKVQTVLILPPVADAGPTPDGDPNDGPYICSPNQTITLDGTGSFDPDHNVPPNKGINAFQWQIQQGGGQLANANTSKPGFTCPASGTTTVSLQVTDSDNQSNTDTALIKVVVLPVADAGPTPDGNPSDPPYTCRANQAITLDGTGSFDPDHQSDPNKGIVSFQWQIQQGGGQLTNATNSKPSFTCPTSGNVTVSLKVTDSDGGTNTDTATIQVTQNVPPVAKAGGPYTCKTGQTTIQLNGTNSFDPDHNVPPNKGIVKFEWDLNNNGQFNDPSDSTSATPTANCPAQSSSQTVKLRVTDSDGATATDTTTISTPRLCTTSGKLDNLIKELLLKGFPYKDIYIELKRGLAKSVNELEDILSLVTPDATDSDLDEALSKLSVFGSVADDASILITEIESAKAEYICEIDALKPLLTKAIADKKFGRTTGGRILKALDAIEKILNRLSDLLAALQTKLANVDNAVNDPALIKALEDHDADAAAKALEKAHKLAADALNDVDIMLKKFLSQLLKAQSTIETNFKIELNNRALGKKNATPWIGVEGGELIIRGLTVSTMKVDVYTLSGERLAQAQSVGDDDHIALESLMSQTHANGVYMYIVQVMDVNGWSWKSELEKLVWVRH